MRRDVQKLLAEALNAQDPQQAVELFLAARLIHITSNATSRKRGPEIPRTADTTGPPGCGPKGSGGRRRLQASGRR